MQVRAQAHAVAIVAISVLAMTWSTTSTSFVALRASALLVVVLYLIFILISILRPRRDEAIVYVDGLWDDEVDSLYPATDHPEPLEIGREQDIEFLESEEFLTVTEIPGGIVVQFGGLASMGDRMIADRTIRDRVRGLATHRRVILDFEFQIFWPDALFLGMLIELRRLLFRGDGDLVLCNLSTLTSICFAQHRLGDRFRIVASRRKAFEL